jgi:hypothetical protein
MIATWLASILAAGLGDLPLALEQAAAWQAETGMPVAEYLELFDERLKQLLERQDSPQYPMSVAATWSIVFERLEVESPASIQLLELCAFFGPEPIPFRLLKFGRLTDLKISPERPISASAGSPDAGHRPRPRPGCPRP